LPRWGLVPSILISIGLYVGAAFITMRLAH
jgi:hypothetical protein